MTLTVATFNLKDFFHARSPEESAVVNTKLENVAKLLREADADLVALQEVGEEDLLQQLFSEQLGLPRMNLLLGKPDHRGIRCAIASRFALISAEALEAATLSFPRFNVEDPEPFGASIPLRRSVLRVRADVPGFGVTTLFTAHLKSQLATPLREHGEALPISSPSEFAEAILRSLVQRSAEALHLKRLVELEMSTEQALVLACGDFNDTPDSVPVRVLLSGEPDKRLIDLVRQANLPSDQDFTTLHNARKNRIDYVLASPALAGRMQTTRILNEGLRDHGPFSKSAPLEPDSDHAPVVAVFH